MGREAKLVAPSCRPGSSPACAGSAGHLNTKQISTGVFPAKTRAAPALAVRWHGLLELC